MKKIFRTNFNFGNLNIKKPATILIYAYLMLIFMIYPFYLRNGYIDIDYSKYYFLFTATKWLVIAITIGIVIEVFCKTENEYAFSKLSVPDIFLIAYLLISVISVVFSIDRSIALEGQPGWYMGASLIIMLGIMYFFISRLCRLGNGILLMAMMASAFVFVLGILNRFSIWPFPIEGSYSLEFLSTMGNIGWYCGYISVTAPLGLSFYILKTDLSKAQRIILIFYLYIVFMASLSQGADSIFIILAVMFSLGLTFAGNSSTGLYRWLEAVMVFCLSGQTLNVIRHVNLKLYKYSSTNLCDIFNDKLTTLYILLPVACVYILLKLRKYIPGEKSRALMRKSSFILFIIVILAIILMVINTCFIGKTYDAVLEGKETQLFKKLALKFLYFSDDWGSGRGKTISLGIKIFNDQDILHKMIGIGPDCFSTYIYKFSELAEETDHYFAGSTLTNAHSEIITCLVNIGILGTAAFYGFMISLIHRCFHLQKKDIRCLAIAMCIICYIAYNLLNYANVLNYPFMILLAAIAENYLKGQQAHLSS